MKKAAGISAAAACALVAIGITAYAAYSSKSIKSVTNDFSPAEIKIAVQETNGKNEDGTTNNAESNTSAELTNSLEWTSDEDNMTAEKKVSVANLDESGKNNADAFIRVCIIPRWTAQIKDSNGNTLTDSNGNALETDVTNTDGITQIANLITTINGNSYQLGVVVFCLNENWSDNWIYNSKDGYFYCRTAVKPGESTPTLLESVYISGEDYDNLPEGVSLKIDVLADSIQTEGQDSREVSALETRWGTPENLGIVVTTNSDGTLALTEYSESEEKEEQTAEEEKETGGD